MKERIFYVGLIVVVIVGLIYMRNHATREEPQVVTAYDSFAQCLTDKGAKFYGAYWCPHCQEQKKMLKNSKKLPYIECSTADGKGQLQMCTDLGITGYPTWIFADGSRLDSEQKPEALSEKTGCELPQV